MVRFFTTGRPPKDFVSPSTSMTISGATPGMAPDLPERMSLHPSLLLGRRRADAQRKA